MRKFKTAKLTRIVLAAIIAMSMYGTAYAESGSSNYSLGIAGAARVNEVENEDLATNGDGENPQESEREEEDRLDERINGVEQSISDLNGRVNRLDGKINKGVALAIAHAALKPLDYDPNYKWSGALGVGNYHGENAIAAGAFYQANKDLMFNISISACGNEKGVGAGVSVRLK